MSLREALNEGGDHVYEGLLTVALRLVFLILLEERNAGRRAGTAGQQGSVSALRDELEARAKARGEALEHGFGAWPRVLACFEFVDGVDRAPTESVSTSRRLFDSRMHPFLGQSDPSMSDGPEPPVPRISDRAVLRLLHSLSNTTSSARDVELLGGLYEELMGYVVVRPEGVDERPARLVIRPGEQRRRTRSHYTPRSLAEPLVRRTLEPLLAQAREGTGSDGRPSSTRLLGLRICDPSMGSGAFLLEACRLLADELHAAWRREGALESVGREHGDGSGDFGLVARRLVARHCLYGVDENPLAVELGKLSLWLLVGSREPLVGFLDRHLVAGDSLVGLTDMQARALTWTHDDGRELVRADPDRLRDAADVVVSTYFWPDDRALTRRAIRKGRKSLDRDRRACLEAIRPALLTWLGHPRRRPLPSALRRRRDRVRELLRPMHWELCFPELFGADGSGMDAVLGNPPFMAGKSISTNLGAGYAEWLATSFVPSHGNADLCAYFLRRAGELLRGEGTIGFLATNTIGQGDTRVAGLQPLLRSGARIYEATRNTRWPAPGASVSISVVHLAMGRIDTGDREVRLDGESCTEINSMLRAMPERGDPRPLPDNAGRSFIGSYVLGRGFVLEPAEARALLERSPRNRERIAPFMGGAELNTSPSQDVRRYAIDFGDLDEDTAAQWPELLEIVRARVKPVRDRQKRTHLRERWWQYADKRPGLYRAIRGLSRCLACSNVSKHCVFAFQPVDRVFAHTLVLFPLTTYAGFGLLQSRVHERWARLLGSTLEDRLRYAPTDCFETFPFPPAPTLGLDGDVQRVARALYLERAEWMDEQQQGLTKTYNALLDPDDRRSQLDRLRRLHEDLDRAVLAAYGRSEIEVPPYAAGTRAQLRRFEDEVLDLLLALNAERASEGAR